MNKNLKKVQQNAIEMVKQALEIFEIEQKRPVLLVTFNLAEKPLSREDLIERTGLQLEQMSPELEKMLERKILVQNEDGEFEFNPDMKDEVIPRFKKQARKVLDLWGQNIKENRNLLSRKDNYSDYDYLMNKFLRTKLRKVEFLHKILKRKMAFVDFIETDQDEGEIQKVRID
ncbi:MAG: hypothetical protein ACLFQV_00380 [Vulcanimicrobiota bacterium]